VYLTLLGAPGSGKGTQAEIISSRTGWKHISTGDMLREAVAKGSELGKAAKGYMERGTLVPDDLVIDMLVERLGGRDAGPGFILDGFSRNLVQAEALDQALQGAGRAIDLALNIVVPDDELVKRLSARWLCSSCGAIYHVVSNPPAVPGRCDRCGHELNQRDDDKPETVRARLQKQKPPFDMLNHYRQQDKLVDVDGAQPVEAVTAAVLAAIGARV
jgi:adenylate kinase